MNREVIGGKVKEMMLRKRNGITLVALVVTIVILIILATISMIALFGENGLITKSEKGKELHEQGKVEEQNNLDMYTEYSGNYLNGVHAGIQPPKPEVPKGPNGKPLVNKDTGTTGDVKCNIYDMAGNVREWKTENCSYVDPDSAVAIPCTSRGGYYGSESYYTSSRNRGMAVYSVGGLGFRPGLYIK